MFECQLKCPKFYKLTLLTSLIFADEKKKKFVRKQNQKVSDMSEVEQLMESDFYWVEDCVCEMFTKSQFI